MHLASFYAYHIYFILFSCMYDRKLRLVACTISVLLSLKQILQHVIEVFDD